MQCDDFERFFESDDPRERIAFDAHVAGCATCRARAADHARIDALARSLRQPVAAPGLRDRIEGNLAAAIHPPRRTGRVVWAAAAAAAVILALSSFSLRLADAKGPRPAVMELAEACSVEAEIRRIEEELAGIEPRFREESRTGEERAGHGAGEAEHIAGEIDYIDSNIENCRRLAAHNAMNRGVRRSLLASYRKKVEIIRNYLSED